MSQYPTICSQSVRSLPTTVMSFWFEKFDSFFVRIQNLCFDLEFIYLCFDLEFTDELVKDFK